MPWGPTFQEETGGKRFAIRWLVLQYSVNLSVCALLPLILEPWGHPRLYSVVLIFTPTILNALIWSRAAQFSAQQRNQLSSPPLQHDNDLGLGTGVDQAIFNLVESGRLYGASLLVKQEITVCSLKQAATTQRALLAIRRLRFGLNCKETPLSHRLQKLKRDHPSCSSLRSSLPPAQAMRSASRTVNP